MPEARTGGWIRFASLIALNAVYLVGPLLYGWSVGTVVLLFWFEGLMTALTAAVRLHRHRAFRPARGHFRLTLDGERPRAEGSFLRQFLSLSLMLSAVYLAFLLVIVFGAGGGDDAWHVDLGDLSYGARWIVVVELVRLAIDLFGIRDRPFAWARAHADRAYGSIFLQHFLILLGMFVLAATGGTALAFLALLVLLKVLMDWLSDAPKKETPPGWFRWLLEKKGKDADHHWASLRAEQEQLALENEELVSE